MRREDLDDYLNRKQEIIKLENRIRKLKEKDNQTASDIVKGSDPEFPYTQRSYHIEGVVNWKPCALTLSMESRLKKKIEELRNLERDMEEYVEKIPSAELRMIFEMRVYERKSFKEIGKELNYEESTARKKYEQCLKLSV